MSEFNIRSQISILTNWILRWENIPQIYIYIKTSDPIWLALLYAYIIFSKASQIGSEVSRNLFVCGMHQTISRTVGGSWTFGLRMRVALRLPLASGSKTGVSDSLWSPVSMETLLSLFALVFIIPPMPPPDWLRLFSPGLPGEIWLDLTPWLPDPLPFDPWLPAGPCCCAWFTFGSCDWAPLVTCLPWLDSLFSECIWLAGDGEEAEGVGLQQYVVSVCQWDCKQTAEEREIKECERISSRNIQ